MQHNYHALVNTKDALSITKLLACGFCVDLYMWWNKLGICFSNYARTDILQPAWIWGVLHEFPKPTPSTPLPPPHLSYPPLPPPSHRHPSFPPTPHPIFLTALGRRHIPVAAPALIALLTTVVFPQLNPIIEELRTRQHTPQRYGKKG